MLDVHVIVSPTTQQGWVMQCLESVAIAQQRAGFPVALHQAPFYPGHIGRSRAEGYAMGDYPYVTCVDDDDWVAPDAFACLLPAMLAQHAAIYTRETQWRNDKSTTHNLRQHLRVFRRNVLEGFDFSRWPALDSTALIAHADGFNDSAELPYRVYNYRVRPESNAKRIAYGTHGLVQATRAMGNVHEVRHG